MSGHAISCLAGRPGGVSSRFHSDLTTDRREGRGRRARGQRRGTRYAGQINPATRLELSFKVGGYVDSIATVPGLDGKPRLLQEGDAVHAGMQLAAIRRTEHAQRRAEAQAALAQAQAGADQARLD